MDKTFHITTFVCQMNEHDSEIMAGMLLERGYRQEKERKDANIEIINTCSVRENADKRFFGTLGQLKRRHEKDPDFVVCVCGCMMQQQRIIDQLKAKYPWVDLIFGTHNIYKFAELLTASFESKGMLIDIWKDTDKIVEDLPVERKYPFKSGINIMFGCNNFCSYCIVPYVRGR